MLTETFQRYPSLKRPGTAEVAGLEEGEVYAFPKLDGANASVWLSTDGESIVTGSRNRICTVDSDNQGFAAYIQGERREKLLPVLKQNPTWIIYGEWLVPHTIKTYRPEAWRRFWIFDVWDGEQFLHWDDYSTQLPGLDLIQPMAILKRPNADQVANLLERNTYLLQDGSLGEGVVLKNYDWTNRFGSVTWQKVVRNQFKEENQREFGVQVIGAAHEHETEIAERYVTSGRLEKILERLGTGMERARKIPALLSSAFHDVVTEEIYGFVKSTKPMPTINFKLLHRRIVEKVKQINPEALFGC